MAELRNCPRCGRVFAYFYNVICDRCLQAEEEEFKLVKEYIYDNHGSTVFEVSDATGVSVDKIMRFLREERLEISSENINFILECEVCGKQIKSGRFCEECKKNMADEMRKEFGISQQKREALISSTGKEKMHITRRREGK